MRILAIETSCDETAVAVVEAEGNEQNVQFRVRGNALLSQIELHREYGGVFPNLAKREHAKNLVPILRAALEEAELLHEDTQEISQETHDAVAKLLEREPGLDEQFLEFIAETEPVDVDAIAVTAGPGLEPALWVGINFAKALSLVWGKPLVAVNHMEGHVMAALAQTQTRSTNSETQNDDGILEIKDIRLPVLALLISGGHTELVLMKEWLSYELVGQTRDDAVGEAFDKVARMMHLPYPGGPEISKLAEALRVAAPDPSSGNLEAPFDLPRPMLHDDTCDFSFAGLKTAVLYVLKNRGELSDDEKAQLAYEFENAVAEVLWKKTSRALERTSAETFVIGGGVSANTHLRRVFADQIAHEHPDVTLCIPAAALTTDNAIMIALSGYFRALRREFADPAALVANGNLSLT
jgi:N6-L-threonylcarbamoyladenine synthase